MKVETTQDNLADVMKSIKALIEQDVLIGIPAAKDARKEDGPATNAVIAYMQTYGGTIQIPAREATLYRKIGKNGDFANNGRFVKRKKSNFASAHIIPAHTVTLTPRPFLEPGIVKAKDDIAAQMKKAGKAALNGKPADIEKAMMSAGLIAQRSAQAIISDGEGLAPLAESTLASRRSRGRSGDKPLLDTGQLRNSIVYVIRKK